MRSMFQLRKQSLEKEEFKKDPARFKQAQGFPANLSGNVHTIAFNILSSSMLQGSLWSLLVWIQCTVQNPMVQSGVLGISAVNPPTTSARKPAQNPAISYQDHIIILKIYNNRIFLMNYFPPVFNHRLPPCYITFDYMIYSKTWINHYEIIDVFEFLFCNWILWKVSLLNFGVFYLSQWENSSEIFPRCLKMLQCYWKRKSDLQAT